MTNRSQVIAIVDSGIGGVSVLRSLKEKFNCGNYIYYADNLFMPYGNKSKNQIKKRINKIVNLLKEKYNASYIFIACNTASTCINESDYKNVFIMKFNTDQTYLATELTKRNLPSFNIISDKTLATQIENHINNQNKLKKVVAQHISKHKLSSLSEIVLGCTHYELVHNIFSYCLSNCSIIDNSSYVVNQFKYKPLNNDTNIVIMMSKQDIKLYNKIQGLINLN